jgi:hypothetical protein
MYLSGYDQPNFVATGYTSGFVSYCRPETRRCTAFWIIVTTSQLVGEGKASELLQMDGGLPNEFGEGGRSSSLLTTETLDGISWQLGTYDTPYRMSVAQAYEVAQLAVALLNYDVNHTEDDTPILCMTHERKIVVDMINLVHAAADQSTLLEQLLEPDMVKLAAKGTGEHRCSTRP